MHILSTYFCKLTYSFFIGDSSLLRLMADTFGMTFHLHSRLVIVGDSLSESPTITRLPLNALSFRALARNRIPLRGMSSPQVISQSNVFIYN
jgi:hypothetical protein